MVTLFDTVYGEVSTAEASLPYEDFKSKYLDSIALSDNLIKESFAVDQLRRVIKDMDYDEIDTLFQLSLVQKQENSILQSLPEGADKDSVLDYLTGP